MIAVKNKATQIALFDDDEDAWEDHTLSILQVYKEKYKQGAKAEWLYLGALEMRMGKRTANKFVRLKRFPTKKHKTRGDVVQVHC